jgi:hypothetical protein
VAEAGSLSDDVSAFRARLVAFEPGVYSADACAALAEDLASTAKACEAAALRAATRAAATGDRDVLREPAGS